MDIISTKSTSITPSIKFDGSKGVLEIEGRSIPDDAVDFYRPLIDSLELYAKSPKSLTTVEVKLEYCNTATSKCLLLVFKCLESIQSKGNQVVTNWYYEEDDEDMYEEGKSYQAIVKLTFNMISVKVDL
jgi:hypothetical protein